MINDHARPGGWGLAALAGAAMLGSGVATAAELPPPAVPAAIATPVLFDLAFGGKLLSDYNFRGISQTDLRPAVQGYAELQIWDNFFYAGVFGSNVKLPTNPDAEVDLTAGIRPKLGPVTFDFGVIRYVYPNEGGLDVLGNPFIVDNTDYTELVGKISYTYEKVLTLGANVFHAWDYLHTGATGTYASVTAKYATPFIEGLAFSGELGHYFLGRTSFALGSIDLQDYTYWNAGVSYTFKVFTVDLRYHDTNLSKADCFVITGDPSGFFNGGRSNWCGSAIIASISADTTFSALAALPKP